MIAMVVCVRCPDRYSVHSRVMTLGHVPVLVCCFEHKIWALHEVSDVWCGLLMLEPGHLNSHDDVTFCHQSGFLEILVTLFSSLRHSDLYFSRLGTFFHNVSFCLSLSLSPLSISPCWTLTHTPEHLQTTLSEAMEEGGLPMSLSTRATKNTPLFITDRLIGLIKQPNICSSPEN